MNTSSFVLLVTGRIGRTSPALQIPATTDSMFSASGTIKGALITFFTVTHGDMTMCNVKGRRSQNCFLSALLNSAVLMVLASFRSLFWFYGLQL